MTMHQHNTPIPFPYAMREGSVVSVGEEANIEHSTLNIEVGRI